MSIVTAAAFAITHAASARAGYFGSRVYPLAPPSAPVGVKPPCTLPTHRRRGTGTILVCFPKRAHICASLTFAVHPQPLPVCASMPVEVPQPGLASKPKRANRSPDFQPAAELSAPPRPPSPPQGAPGAFRVPYDIPIDGRAVYSLGGCLDYGARAPFKPIDRALLWWQSLDRDDDSHRSAARKQVKPHLQANVDVCPSLNAGSIWVSRILPPHSAQVRRGTAG
jgi:hypothetical protein